jgi:FkbM family methyltransferase
MDSFAVEFNRLEYRYNTEQPFIKFAALIKRLSARDIVLFGSGVLDMRFFNFFKKNGINAVCYCDNNKTGIHIPTKLPIVSIRQLKEAYPDVNIVITSFKYRFEIANQLMESGFSSGQIFTDFNFLVDMMSISEAKNYFEGWEWAYNYFADDVSKKIIIGRIKSYLFGDSILFSAGCKYLENEVVNLSNNEVFVDVGSAVGSITEAFINKTNNKYKHIYAFEPDIENYEKAKNKLLQYSNVTIMKTALWSRNGVLPFNARGDGGSHICKEITANTTVSATTLDNFFNGNIEKPTFIKVSAEGSEKEIILGANEIIGKRKPALAASVYHQPDDIYETTKCISDINSDYAFCLRHYSEYIYDTILYARNL